MTDLKNHFRLNGKYFDELESSERSLLDKILTSLEDIKPILTERHYMNFIISDNNNSRFDFVLPDSIINHVIEVCIKEKCRS